MPGTDVVLRACQLAIWQRIEGGLNEVGEVVLLFKFFHLRTNAHYNPSMPLHARPPGPVALYRTQSSSGASHLCIANMTPCLLAKTTRSWLLTIEWFRVHNGAGQMLAHADPAWGDLNLCDGTVSCPGKTQRVMYHFECYEIRALVHQQL